MTSLERFKLLTDFFTREGMDYAVIGAYALYAYGYIRATRDMDFITRVEYQPAIIAYLESIGFETVHRSEGFSNHLHAVGFIRLDLIYADKATADRIFAAVTAKLVLESLELPVVSPEHLMALKLFAVKNNSARKLKELADIRELIRRTRLPAATVRGYLQQYGLENLYDDLIA